MQCWKRDVNQYYTGRSLSSVWWMFIGCEWSIKHWTASDVPAVRSNQRLVLRRRPGAGTRLWSRRRARRRAFAGRLRLTAILFRGRRTRGGLGPLSVSVLPRRSGAASGLLTHRLLLGAASGISLRLRFGAALGATLGTRFAPIGARAGLLRARAGPRLGLSGAGLCWGLGVRLPPRPGAGLATGPGAGAALAAGPWPGEDGQKRVRKAIRVAFQPYKQTNAILPRSGAGTAPGTPAAPAARTASATRPVKERLSREIYRNTWLRWSWRRRPDLDLLPE